MRGVDAVNGHHERASGIHILALVDSSRRSGGTAPRHTASQSLTASQLLREGR
jgi:hypothetical protein